MFRPPRFSKRDGGQPCPHPFKEESLGFKRILVPLDGSKTSEAILPKIEELAPVLKASICLLQVVYVQTILDMDRTEIQEALVREADDYLRRIEERVKAKGLKVESYVRYDDNAEEILAHSDKKDIDLIMMSTHGRSGVKRWLLGSIAEKILRHATKPIFLIRQAE